MKKNGKDTLIQECPYVQTDRNQTLPFPLQKWQHKSRRQTYQQQLSSRDPLPICLPSSLTRLFNNWFQIDCSQLLLGQKLLRSFREGENSVLLQESMDLSQRGLSPFLKSFWMCQIIRGTSLWCFIIFWWWLRHWSGERVFMVSLIWTLIFIAFLCMLLELKSCPFSNKKFIYLVFSWMFQSDQLCLPPMAPFLYRLPLFLLFLIQQFFFREQSPSSLASDSSSALQLDPWDQSSSLMRNLDMLWLELMCLLIININKGFISSKINKSFIFIMLGTYCIGRREMEREDDGQGVSLCLLGIQGVLLSKDVKFIFEDYQNINQLKMDYLSLPSSILQHIIFVSL